MFFRSAIYRSLPSKGKPRAKSFHETQSATLQQSDTAKQQKKKETL